MRRPALSRARLGAVPADRAPGWLAEPGDVRVAHLGPGPFHRAHQATFTDDCGPGWGIAACAARGRATVDRLAAQDRLFTVMVLGEEESARIHAPIGAVGDRAAFVDHLADPAVTVATMTVTEAHYPVRPGTRILDDAERSVAADLAGDGIASLPGLLTRGLWRRWRDGGAPISVLSCDNLRANGALTRDLVTGFAERAAKPAAFVDWVTSLVRFPDTLVDRMTPRPTPADRVAAAELTGVDDPLCTVTEPYRMWVIGADVGAERPPWEKAGALIVADVEPYERLKLVVLNAAHTILACLGLLVARTTVDEAMRDPGLAGLVHRFHEREAAPVLRSVDLPVEEFAATVRERFANPRIGHRLDQIATDSSLKIIERIVPLAHEAARLGLPVPVSALGVAGWLRLHDPRRDVVAPFADARADAVRTALVDADATRAARAALAASGAVAEGELPDFTEQVGAALADLRRHPAVEVIASRDA